MPPYEVFIEREVERNIRKIPKELRKGIFSLIIKLKINPRASGIRKITKTQNCYRIRLGDYRIIYEVDDKRRIINIFRIRHRKEAYRNL